MLCIIRKSILISTINLVLTPLSSLVTLLPALVAGAPQQERRSACGDINATRNLGRFYHDGGKDHFYSINVWEQIQWTIVYGYARQTLNAALVFLYATDANSLVPLYRLYQNATQTNLYTASASLRQTLLTTTQPPFADGTFDGTPDGITAYVYPDGSCPGTVPLLWASNPLITDNYYTIDTAEYNAFVANGYTPKGPVAWVYPVPSNRIM